METTQKSILTVEANTKESFRLCKEDIIALGLRISRMQTAHEHLVEEIEQVKAMPTAFAGASNKSVLDDVSKEISKLDAKLQSQIKEINKRQELMTSILTKAIERMQNQSKVVVEKKTKRYFIASKTGMKLHDSHCPFAKNVKGVNKEIFASKARALKKGYMPCKCLK